MCFLKKRIIPLGRHCQTAYQIRRFTGDDTAFYFDWLRTPHHGLVTILKDNFRGSFLRKNLQITEDGTCVMDKANGVLFRHLFSKLSGTDIVDPDAIDREFEVHRQKIDFLIGRWQKAMQTEEILFVRQDAPDESEAAELFDVLLSQGLRHPFDLLFVVPPGHELTAKHPRIHVERGGPLPSGPSDWKGEKTVWDRVLAKYCDTSQITQSNGINRRIGQSWSIGKDYRASVTSNKVLIFPLPEPGHILPTLNTATFLRTIGCDVSYLTAPRFRSLVENVGARLIPLVSEDIGGGIHSGQHIWYQIVSAAAERGGKPAAFSRVLAAALSETDYGLVLLDRRFTATSRLSIESAMSNQLWLFFSSSLPNWNEPGRQFTPVPTLIFCPKEFEVPKFVCSDERMFYVESSLPMRASEAALDVRADPERPLILATFGTQSVRCRQLKKQIDIIKGLAKRRPEFQFVVATGDLQSDEFCSAEGEFSNLHLTTRVPQVEYLQTARVFITHGGLGSIKEAIAAGVPMVVLPSLFDQPFNAMRVRYHKLGEAIFPERLRIEELENAVLRASDGCYQPHLESMQRRFLELEGEAPSRNLLGEFIN
jgi:UDP:flavonoid glycosyltransferase YjiC (YdhE family)